MFDHEQSFNEVMETTAHQELDDILEEALSGGEVSGLSGVGGARDD